MSEPISQKPYLVRALFEWCTDNGYTPYLAVAVDGQTLVPREFVRNGEIVLNISTLATHHLQLGNDAVTFTARFSGTAQDIYVPVSQITAIYAKETGAGMAFDVPKPMAELEAVPDLEDADAFVGDDEGQDDAAPNSTRRAPVLGIADGDRRGDGDGDDDGDDDDPGPRPSGPPTLRRIK